MKYLKKFNSHADYTSAESGLILPNVSFCLNENEVHYLPFVDPSGGHPYVEIGGIKWATMNIGATSETEYGNYYQYGKGADTYQVTYGQSDYSGNENPLATSADTVAQTWGGNWRMPTQTELQSLTANTTYEFVTNYNGSGVNGGLFTSKTDSSKKLFFPAAAYYLDGSLDEGVGSLGDVWSSTPFGLDHACKLHFSGSGKRVDSSFLNLGHSVRGVLGS